ncbi:MAG: isochorismatase family protein [Candidatus Kapabacteria bacterium]|nr:isochorismatase family protein [Candidatus Kapabacteria bacterium]
MRIEPHSSLAICIDVQERLFHHMDSYISLEMKLVTLTKGLQLFNVPMIISEQYTKGLGETVSALVETFNDYTPMEKSAFSCYDDTAIRSAIEQSDRKTIILYGIESHVCVLQTAIDLRAHNYSVVVVADAVSSRHAADKDFALRRMQHEGVMLASTESLLFEICRYSGTDTFKKLSELVK